DTLRTMVIYTDDVEDVSSSGESELEAGDYVSLVEEPTAWKLSYKGLDVAEDDRYNLKFEIKTSDKDISESKGPMVGCDGGVGEQITGDHPTACSIGNPMQVACRIYAPYVEVTSGDTGSVFEVDRSDVGGTLSDSEFIIALASGTGGEGGGAGSADARAAVCDTSDGSVTIPDGDYEDSSPTSTEPYTNAPISANDDVLFGPGTIFMKLSSSSNNYGVSDYLHPGKTNPGTEVRYEDIGDGDNEFLPPHGGVILIERHDDVELGVGDNQLADIMESSGDWGSAIDCGTDTDTDCVDVFFAISEKAGTGSSNEFVDYWIFGIDETNTGDAGDATFDFNSLDTTANEPITSDDEEILYGHAASEAPPATYDGVDPISGPIDQGYQFVEEGYISERGSVFDMIDSNTVEFDMAHRLIKAQWWLGPSETSSASDSTTVVTLGEGESTTVGGVTVKVLEITEDVGACSAAGGAVSCTADMSGVSAVVMPNNAPSVEVAVPYSGNYGNLVVMDTDAVGLNTVIAVGGDAVNSVSSDLLASSPVDWTTETTVVREVTAGKIVVAGAEASDTMQAGKDFLAQLQNA
ncbi:hypothetical protein KKE92_05385, partial [Candidatus Micrarchaeota archaeon]|nr:hypothetical protein [Candidatus Micrarchaeota archaeon]